MIVRLFIDLEKAKRDKSKLVPVQKQVTRGGKQFMQTFYVSPAEAKQLKEKKKKDSGKSSTKSTVNVKEQLRPIRKALGTERYKEYLKANGITWTPNTESAGADTMRASMATKKWIEAGNSLDEDLYQHMLKGGSVEDYKKNKGVEKKEPEKKEKKSSQISDKLKKLIEESENSAYLLTESFGDAELRQELKDKVKEKYNRFTTSNLEKFYKEHNGGSNVSTYLPVKEGDPLKFELGKEVFTSFKYRVEGAREGSLEDNGGGKALGKTIYLSPNVLEDVDEKTALRVFTHEIAHTLTNRFPELERHINNNLNGIFGKVNRKENKFEPALDKEFLIGAQGSNSNPEEVWADAYSAYLADPMKLKEKNKEIFDFVDRVANKVPKHKEMLEGLLKDFKSLRLKLEEIDNYEDLEKYAEKSNTRVRLKGIGLDTAKDIVATYDKVRKLVPLIKDIRLKVFSEDPDDPRYPMKHNYYAYARGTTVVVNEQRYNNPAQLEKDYKNDVKMKWHPKGTDYKGIITHEIAHVVHNEMSKVSGEKVTDITGRIKRKVLKNLGLKAGDVVDGLANYATVNTKEFFAEAFTEWADSNNPRPIAKEFGKVLQEELKKIDAR